MMKTIVCTLDPEAPAARAVAAWSAALASRLHAGLLLFHAVSLPADQLHPTAEFERGGDLAARCEVIRNEIAELMRGIDYPFQSAVVAGEPAEALRDLCHRQQVDLVVAGSRSVTGIKKLILGTLVARLAQMSGCPLLFLRPGLLQAGRAEGALERVGVCCDLSDGDIRLIQYGAEMASACGARIRLLHAMERAMDETIVDPEDGPYGQVQALLEARLAAKLRARWSLARPAAAEAVDVSVAGGAVQDSMLDLVHGLGIDLLVIGERRHSTFGKLVVGSSTHTILHRAPCHVLTVPLEAVGPSHRYRP